MVVIELFVYVFIASMMVICVNVVNKRGIIKKSDFIYFYVLLSLIILQIVIISGLTFIPVKSQIPDSFLHITPLYLGTILTLVLIYLITQTTVSSVEIQEDARVWIGWTMLFVLAASFCTLLIGLPDTMTDLYRMPFALVLCVGMQYYPLVIDRLKKLKTAAEERTIEQNVDGHKETVINLAIESWRFAKNYERMLTRIDTKQTKRYKSHLDQFVGKAEESLDKLGLRLVNVEGYLYDPGMAATPLNIEDFDPEDRLVVDQMLEPIIMEGTVLAKTGTVTLRRKE